MEAGLFSVISIAALLGYVFIFMIFMNAEKNNLITSFLTLLLAMIFWTGGSLLMRIQFFPSYVFWYHVSLGGLLLMAYGYYNFVSTFLNKKNTLLDRYYRFALTLVFCINLPTGLLLRQPSITIVEGGTLFVYDIITPFVILLYIPTGLIVVNILQLLYSGLKQGRKEKQKLYPLILGVVLLGGGNVIVLAPILKGIPVDIIAGVLNTLCLLYVLLKRRLLKPKMVASTNVAYLFSSLLGFALFYVSYPVINSILINNPDTSHDTHTWVYLLYYAGMSMLFYLLWHSVVNKIALKDEEHQDAIIKEYSSNIAKSLDAETVISHTINTIRYATGTSNVYIGVIEQGTGNCIISYSDKAMNGLSYTLQGDSTFLKWLYANEGLEKITEFYLSAEYKKLTEADVERINKLEITHVMGLKDANQLRGVIFITDNNPHKKLLDKDMSLISSISTLASTALSEEQFRPLVTEMQLGLSLNEILCDELGAPREYRLISVNPSYERLLGVKKEDIVGKSLLNSFPGTNSKWVTECGKVALSGKSTQLTIYNTDQDKHFSTTIYSPKRGQFAVIIDDITVQKKAEKQVEYMSYHDALTGLFNRRYFDVESVQLDKPQNLPLTIVMADLNKLKYINDTFGHDAGDEAITLSAQVLLKSCLGSSVIARLGGDEFIILMPNTSAKDAEVVINRLENNLKGLEVAGVPLTISFGCATKCTMDENMNELVKQADATMYTNKMASRKTQVIDPDYVDDRM